MNWKFWTDDGDDCYHPADHCCTGGDASGAGSHVVAAEQGWIPPQNAMLTFRETDNRIDPGSTALVEVHGWPVRERCRSVEQKRTSLPSEPGVGFGSQAEVRRTRAADVATNRWRCFSGDSTVRNSPITKTMTVRRTKILVVSSTKK